MHAPVKKILDVPAEVNWNKRPSWGGVVPDGFMGLVVDRYNNVYMVSAKVAFYVGTTEELGVEDESK